MRLLLIMILISLLPACADVAVSGAQAVYNRRQLQNNFNDQYQTLQAYRALNSEQFEETNIAIATYNNQLLIAGQVPRAYQKMEAERRVKQATDVSEIHNELTISNPSSSLIRLSDTWITTKIKSKLIASNDLDASKIKVITENGTVFLMGIIPKDEAEAALDIARDTAGVTRIVKIFKYIRICSS